MSPPPPARRRLLRLGAGLLLGLGLAELGFAARDRFAFPHMNTLVADAELGARLEPGARSAIALGENPRAAYTIDEDGWRVSDPAAAGPETVVVVGDSQVFGLGVGDAETLPARLSALSGRPVRNAGVPTWGPEEYLAALDASLGATGGKTGVLVFNFGNDLFELGRPNTERHAVYDGWAVRIETQPDRVVDFPGRRWLMGRSHLVYALRSWTHSQPEGPAQALPSEGDWEAVYVAMAGAPPPPIDAPAGTTGIEAQLEASAEARRRHSIDAGRAAVGIMQDLGLDFEDIPAVEAVVSHSHIGDIVGNPYAEASRSVPVTAELLARGRRLRKDMAPRIARYIRENPDHYWVQELVQAEEARTRAAADVDALARQVATAAEALSPFTGMLERAEAICQRHGAALVVVALPLDVQVDAGRFAAYGAPERDMAPSLAWMDALVREAEARGHRALNLLPALKAVGPGAWLQGDLHLSAAGQGRRSPRPARPLVGPAPAPPPGPGLAPGRSWVPLPAEWSPWEENHVRGSSRNHCATMRIREWQRIRCTATPGEPAPLAAQQLAGPLEAMVWVSPDQTDILVPVLPGRDARFALSWADRQQQLSVPGDGSPPEFADWTAEAPVRSPTLPPALQRCVQSQEGPPEAHFARAEPACASHADCGQAIACLQGRRSAAPSCDAGAVNAGSAGHCFAACNADHPCTIGECTPWDGGAACL